jgi:hypothetical protein
LDPRSTIIVRDSRLPQKPRPGPITASDVALRDVLGVRQRSTVADATSSSLFL